MNLTLSIRILSWFQFFWSEEPLAAAIFSCHVWETAVWDLTGFFLAFIIQALLISVLGIQFQHYNVKFFMSFFRFAISKRMSYFSQWATVVLLEPVRGLTLRLRFYYGHIEFISTRLLIITKREETKPQISGVLILFLDLVLWVFAQKVSSVSRV